jgi:transcriptional regulator with XRE-family HTH domain
VPAYRSQNENGSATISTVAAQFAQDVRARMQVLGMSQRELAEKLGISQPRIAELLSGRHAANLDTVERVAKALQCDATIRLNGR